jgi:hypothetical protein
MNASSSRARRLAAGAGLVLASAVVAACGGSVDAVPPSPTPTRTPAPTVTTPEPRSLLSGRTEPDGPVLVVKIDNSPSARPHEGLTAADVVYVQQVEGGISRLAAIYSTRLPEQVVPVRSARETDAELLPQYGPVAVAFSGSVSSVHRKLRNAGLVDVSADVGPVGYYRVAGGRYAPHNLAADPKKVLGRVDDPAEARDVGFRFGAAPSGGTKATTVKAAMPAARMSFVYNRATGTYDVLWDGTRDRTADEGQVTASTVIIQSVDVSMLTRNDSSGTTVPFTSTVGKGDATIVRDGKAYKAKWSRDDADSPTTWTINGKPAQLKAGQVWVVLLDEDRSASIS